MDEPTGITGWVLAGVATIVSTLAGLVAMFYKQQISDYKSNEAKMDAQHMTTEAYLKNKVAELEKRADECEDDREQLRIKYARLEERVSSLEVNKKNRHSIG